LLYQQPRIQQTKRGGNSKEKLTEKNYNISFTPFLTWILTLPTLASHLGGAIIMGFLCQHV
jgi:hypothetical protein